MVFSQWVWYILQNGTMIELVTSCLLWRHRRMTLYAKPINRLLALEGWFEKPKNMLFGHVRVIYVIHYYIHVTHRGLEIWHGWRRLRHQQTPQLTIHIKENLVPNGEWALHPMRRGVTLSLYEWKELKTKNQNWGQWTIKWLEKIKWKRLRNRDWT